jgi:hypothetical protein
MSKVIKQQWQEMVKKGILPIIEIQIKEDDYLIVNLELSEKGIEFRFDTSPTTPYKPLPVSFDGDILKINEGVFVLPFDCSAVCWESLDCMLDVMIQNINEGFLIPNDLFYYGE